MYYYYYSFLRYFAKSVQRRVDDGFRRPVIAIDIRDEIVLPGFRVFRARRSGDRPIRVHDYILLNDSGFDEFVFRFVIIFFFVIFYGFLLPRNSPISEPNGTRASRGLGRTVIGRTKTFYSTWTSENGRGRVDAQFQLDSFKI